MRMQTGPVLQHLSRLRLNISLLVAIHMRIIARARRPMIDHSRPLSSRLLSARSVIPARPH